MMSAPRLAMLAVQLMALVMSVHSHQLSNHIERSAAQDSIINDNDVIARSDVTAGDAGEERSEEQPPRVSLEVKHQPHAR